MDKIVIYTGNSKFGDLIPNKEYTVVDEYKNGYYIINEQGTRVPYFKTAFKLKEMKPKLNLADKTQNWCVKGDKTPEMTSALQRFSRKDNRGMFGSFWSGAGDHYYGVYTNEQYNNRNIKGTLYSKQEFLDALAEYENGWTPKVGEEVEFSQDEIDWCKKFYLATLGLKTKLYIGVTDREFTQCPGTYCACSYKYMRKIEPKIDISISVKINGIDKDPSTFTDSEWLAFKK